MEEKLRPLEEKYNEIEFTLSRPETWEDPEKAARLSREKAELAPLMEVWARYRRFASELRSANELLSDPEMRDLARETARDAMARRAEINQTVKEKEDGAKAALAARRAEREEQLRKLLESSFVHRRIAAAYPALLKGKPFFLFYQTLNLGQIG